MAGRAGDKTKAGRGTAVASVCNLLDLDLAVVGGSVARGDTPDELARILRAAVLDRSPVDVTLPTVSFAQGARVTQQIRDAASQGPGDAPVAVPGYPVPGVSLPRALVRTADPAAWGRALLRQSGSRWTPRSWHVPRPVERRGPPNAVLASI